MGTLEDKLKLWKKQHGAEAEKPAARPSKGPPRVLRRDEPGPSHPSRRPPEEARPLSDADLFADAVARVDRDAVLEKFTAADRGDRGDGRADDGADRGGVDRGGVGAPVGDEELFRRFVGATRPTGKASASSSRQPGPTGKDGLHVLDAPGSQGLDRPTELRLDLGGVPQTDALRRLRAFVDEGVRAGAARLVVLGVGERHADAVATLREHPAVLSVRDAPQAPGKPAGRILTLRR